MKIRGTVFACFLLLAAATAPTTRSANTPQRKEYLTDAEADKIRDAYTPAERIELYISFADDRLKKFDYEVHRTTPESRRSEILNGLLNGYSGCVDDAADQIDVAQERHLDIRDAVKKMKEKDQGFLEILQNYDKPGPDFEEYQETLEDAIEGTKEAISDAEEAEKEMHPGPVRRKQ